MSMNTERIDPVAYDKKIFFQDLRMTSKVIDAPFNEAVVQNTLEVFNEE